jgi:hypothetical protein
MTVHIGGGPLSGGGMTHFPLMHANPWPSQFWQACPPCPHVPEEKPPAHSIGDAQQPLQLLGPQTGGGGAASRASTPASSASSPASPPV